MPKQFKLELNWFGACVLEIHVVQIGPSAISTIEFFKVNTLDSN